MLSYIIMGTYMVLQGVWWLDTFNGNFNRDCVQFSVLVFCMLAQHVAILCLILYECARASHSMFAVCIIMHLTHCICVSVYLYNLYNVMYKL